VPPYPKPRSQAQRGAMQAAAAGKSTLGIPPKVGKEFAAGDPGGTLPAVAPKKPAGPPPRKKISRLPSY
jgi:hypothetical protein